MMLIDANGELSSVAEAFCSLKFAGKRQLGLAFMPALASERRPKRAGSHAIIERRRSELAPLSPMHVWLLCPRTIQKSPLFLRLHEIQPK